MVKLNIFLTFFSIVFSVGLFANDWETINWDIDQKTYEKMIESHQKNYEDSSSFETALITKSKEIGKNIQTGLARLPKVLWAEGEGQKCAKEKYFAGITCFRKIAKTYEEEAQKVAEAVSSGILTSDSDFPNVNPVVTEILIRACGNIPDGSDWQKSDAHSLCVGNVAENLKIRAHNSSASLSHAQKGIQEFSIISKACEKKGISKSRCKPTVAKEAAKDGLVRGMEFSESTKFTFLENGGNSSGANGPKGESNVVTLEEEAEIYKVSDVQTDKKNGYGNSEDQSNSKNKKGTGSTSGNSEKGVDGEEKSNQIGWKDPFASSLEEKKQSNCLESKITDNSIETSCLTNRESIKPISITHTEFISDAVGISDQCTENFIGLNSERLDAGTHMLETQVMAYVDRLNRVKGLDKQSYQGHLETLEKACPKPNKTTVCNPNVIAQGKSSQFIRDMVSYANNNFKDDEKQHKAYFNKSMEAVEDLRTINAALIRVLPNFPTPDKPLQEVWPDFLPCQSAVGLLDDVKKIWKASHFKTRCGPIDEASEKKIRESEESTYQLCKLADTTNKVTYDDNVCKTAYLDRIKDEYEKDIRKGRAPWEDSKSREKIDEEIKFTEMISYDLITGLESPTGKTIVPSEVINGLESRDLECKKKAQLAKKLIAQKFSLLAEHPELLAETFSDGKKPSPKWKNWKKNCSFRPSKGAAKSRYDRNCTAENKPEGWDPKKSTKPLHEYITSFPDRNKKLIMAQMDESQIKDELTSLKEGIKSICSDPLSAGDEILVDDELYSQFASCANNLTSDQKSAFIGGDNINTYKFWDKYNNRSAQKIICKQRKENVKGHCDRVEQIKEGALWTRVENRAKELTGIAAGPVLGAIDVAGCVAMFTGVVGALYSGGKAAIAGGVRAGIDATAKSLVRQSVATAKGLATKPGAALGGGGYYYSLEVEDQARKDYEKLKRRAGTSPEKLAAAKNALEEAQRATHIGYFLIGSLIPGGEVPHTPPAKSITGHLPPRPKLPPRSTPPPQMRQQGISADAVAKLPIVVSDPKILFKLPPKPDLPPHLRHQDVTADAVLLEDVPELPIVVSNPIIKYKLPPKPELPAHTRAKDISDDAILLEDVPTLPIVISNPKIMYKLPPKPVQPKLKTKDAGEVIFNINEDDISYIDNKKTISRSTASEIIELDSTEFEIAKTPPLLPKRVTNNDPVVLKQLDTDDITTNNFDPIKTPLPHSSEPYLLVTEVRERQVTGRLKDCCDQKIASYDEVTKGFAEAQLRQKGTIDDPYFVSVGKVDLRKPASERIYAPENPNRIGYKYTQPKGVLEINFAKDYHGLKDIQFEAMDFINAKGKKKLRAKSEALAIKKLKESLGSRAKDMEITYLSQGGLNAVFKMCPKSGSGCKVAKMPLFDKQQLADLKMSKNKVDSIQVEVNQIDSKLSAGNLNVKQRKILEKRKAELAQVEGIESLKINEFLDEITYNLSGFRTDLAHIKWADELLSRGNGPTINGKEFLEHAGIPDGFNNIETLSRGIVVQDYIGVKVPKKIVVLPSLDERNFIGMRKIKKGSADEKIIKLYGDPKKLKPEINQVYDFVASCSKAQASAVKKYCSSIIKENKYPSRPKLLKMIQGSIQWERDVHSTVLGSSMAQFNKGRKNPIFKKDMAYEDIDSRGIASGSIVTESEVSAAPVGIDPLGGNNKVFNPETGKITYIDR